MTVRLRSNVEPFSVASAPNDPTAPRPLLARSRAGVVLEHELRRYCQGQVRGRSFLVSGHRGAGKTTLVEHLLQRFQIEALNQHAAEALNRRVALKPLPVHLLGPVLLPPLPPPDRAARRKATAASEDGGDPSNDQQVLIEVAQALHRAVALEYSQRFHRLALLRRAAGRHDADELVEMAARFQIELTEAPPPSRLLQFWRRAGALPHGLLFEPGDDRGRQQGWRELVALTGVSHLYQRISGQLTEKDEQTDSGSRQQQQTHGLDGKWADVVTALGSAGAGGAVAVAGLGSGHPVAGGLIGLLTALGAGFAVKLTTTRQMERKIDRTFVPDLSVKTLHRVMPELFDRLLAAGLAPVFVVDELDKVDNLLARIQSLLDHLKKLFAERSFTCLITDRGFYEALHLHERQELAAALGHGA